MMLLIVRAALPVFLSVAVCAALVVPEVALKLSEGGVSKTAGVGVVVPLPVRLAVCGEPEALSVTESVAVKPAADAGVKVTETVQLD